MRPPFPYLLDALRSWTFADLEESVDHLFWALRHPREILYDERGNEVASRRWFGRQEGPTAAEREAGLTDPIEATTVSSEWLNVLQEEIASTIEDSGLVLNRTEVSSRTGGLVEARVPDLEDDFERAVEQELGDLVRGDAELGNALWAALSNVVWHHRDGARVAYSFRAAGDLVAAIRREGNYLDWYSETYAGLVAPPIALALWVHGWRPSSDPEQDGHWGAGEFEPSSEAQAAAAARRLEIREQARAKGIDPEHPAWDAPPPPGSE